MCEVSRVSTTAYERRELAEEAVERPRRRRLAPLLALVPVLGCAQPAPEALPEVVRMDEEERASYERTIEGLRGEVAASMATAARLEERGADVEVRGELEACRADLERHRAGLARAVAQLNQRPTAAAQVPPAHTAAPRTARDYGNVHSSTPQVRVAMTEVRVEGRLYSTRDTNTSVTVVVRLMENERPAGVRRVPVIVGAHGGREYTVVFDGAPSSTSIYTAEVTLEY